MPRDAVRLAEGVWARPDEVVLVEGASQARQLLDEDENIAVIADETAGTLTKFRLEGATSMRGTAAEYALALFAEHKTAIPIDARRNYCYACPHMKGGPHEFRNPKPVRVEPIPDSKSGAGVRVLVADTQMIRPRLAGNVHFEATAVELAGDDRGEAEGHATFVGCVAALAAPGITVGDWRVLDGDGFGDDWALTDKLSELRERTHPLPQILNLSLCLWTLDEEEEPVRLLGELDRWAEAGTVIVAAAGNEGVARKTWPAAAENVIGVTAPRVGADGALGDVDWANVGEWVDAGAPGEDIRAPFIDTESHTLGGAEWTGTSFAAPHVAGRIAATMTQKGVSAQEAWAELRGEPPFAMGQIMRPFIK